MSMGVNMTTDSGTRKRDKFVFFGGIPTEPDIKRLRERWPEEEMKVGDVIKYEDLQKFLGLHKDSKRFRTVTHRWRRIVESETHIILGAETGVGFKVLSEPEKVLLSGSKLRMAGRAASRSHVILQRTDRKQLSHEDLQAVNHQQSVSAKILASASLRSNAAPLPVLE